jgi:hypothetical protein
METASKRQILLNAFSAIRRDDRTHTYYVGHDRYPSSTTKIVGTFGQEFDEKKMSQIIANRENVTQQEILDRWAEIREEACSRGSLVHKCLEHVPMVQPTEAFVILKQELSKPEFKQLFNEKELRQVTSGISWYNDLEKQFPGKYEILCLELMMYHQGFKHCGTADMILVNNDTGKLIIADWKTNKDLFKTDYYRTRPLKYLKYPFQFLIDCPYSKYSLQFSHYQMMIEAATHLRVEDRWCIWLTDDNIVEGYSKQGDGWVQYNTQDYSLNLQHYFSQNQPRPTSLKDLCKK